MRARAEERHYRIIEQLGCRAAWPWGGALELAGEQLRDGQKPRRLLLAPSPRAVLVGRNSAVYPSYRGHDDASQAEQRQRVASVGAAARLPPSLPLRTVA